MLRGNFAEWVLALNITVRETTVDNHTTFMRPATNTGILAVATALRAGRTMGFAEARLLTGTLEPQLIANVVGTYMVPLVAS